METKANYVAVGAFVLTCMLGLVAVLLWLAGAPYRQELSHYQTFFKGSVTGLGTGTKVRFNGIDVGQIGKLKFDPDDPNRVIVVMDVDPTLKLHEDTVASIASEGLTGGAYVEIEGGTKNSPILRQRPGQDYPVIKSEASTLQQLAQSAPQLIAKLNRIADQLSGVLNPKNQQAFSDILLNLRDMTGALSRHSGDIEATIGNFNSASRALNQNLAALQVVLSHADRVATDTDRVIIHADRILSGDRATQLSQLLSQTRSLVTSLKRVSDDLDRHPTRLIYGDRQGGYTPK